MTNSYTPKIYRSEGPNQNTSSHIFQHQTSALPVIMCVQRGLPTKSEWGKPI